jgi:hypothetical protein
MARQVPSRFIEKVRRVREIVESLQDPDDEASSDAAAEVLPGVRVIRGRAKGQTLAFSLWTHPTDVAELCGDAAVPATTAALVVHRDDARRLSQRGVFVDLSQLVRSESYPGYYYGLFDYATHSQLRSTLARLVPGFALDDGMST